MMEGQHGNPEEMSGDCDLSGNQSVAPPMAFSSLQKHFHSVHFPTASSPLLKSHWIHIALHWQLAPGFRKKDLIWRPSGGHRGVLQVRLRTELDNVT